MHLGNGFHHNLLHMCGHHEDRIHRSKKDLSDSNQWRIYIQKFPARPPPPTGPNSFIFTYVFTEKCLCRRLAPPPTRVGAPPTGNPGSALATVDVFTILVIESWETVTCVRIHYIHTSSSTLTLVVHVDLSDGVSTGSKSYPGDFHR